ncbi:copper amine oxidase N-terminal domain-containing protein [Desulfofundulus thermocisternus]|uniref:copper amine oxidase N-terminal domain-containing protein n=1 Tax=Desulfofundulus thermocisternus TaxID=42471 RepID=UPI00217EB036|nr:copper amine oxidase N-terminal domain-containing protein [Desulfofundulus thermocisternus]MCS5695459.1 copper amine oxidase N-terminal domain-containing protein [Desulfofundulus thermocisternus]
MRKSRKLIAILATLALLATLLVPMVGPAAASTSYRALNVPSVLDGVVTQLGSVIIEVDGGTLKDGDSVNLRLPSDFEVGTVVSGVYNNELIGTCTVTKDPLQVVATAPYSLSGKINELTDSMIQLEPVSEEEFKLKIVGNPLSQNNGQPTDASIIRLDFKAVYVDSGFDGDITLSASAPSTSGFASGKVVIGQVVTGDKKVELAVTNVPSFSDSTVLDPIKIRVVEKKPSALDSGSESLKFKLPSEFEWISDGLKVNTLWGDKVVNLSDPNHTNPALTDKAIGLEFTGFNDDELEVNVKVWDNGSWVYKTTDGRDGTSEETAFEIVINIQVEDEADAKVGDVVVSTSGSKSDVSPTELVVAKYGQYEATVEAGDAPTIYAGQIDARIGDVIIKESIAGSLVKGRTILLTLPEWAKWRKIDTDSDNGVSLKFAGFPGTDGRTAKWTVDSQSTSDPAELKLEKMEVALRPGKTGDLTIEVAGTAGVKGTITVAKVEQPATIELDGAPVDMKIGTTAEIGDVLIKETNPGSIDDDKNLILDLPEGVRFVGTPTVKVEEGDIALLAGDVRTQADSSTDDNQVVIPVDNKSSKASTIRVSGIKIAADRTVSEGEILLKLKGSAVAASIDKDEIKDKYGTPVNGMFQVDGKDAFSASTYESTLFPGYSTTASVTVAKVVTPAPGEQKATVVFKVGDTKFTVNGAEQTMDVAPYVKNGRTFIPVRYSAQAVGVTPENILYSGGKVTLLKGDKVVQFTIGSNVMLINGVAVNMDVKAEITNGRTMLPFRYVAQALGAQVNWDPTAQTVTMTL